MQPAGRTAPFTVQTRGEELHHLIRLVNWETGASVRTFFVRAGESMDVPVPFGSYRLRYAAGSLWYGERYFFGRRTEYCEADKRLVFNGEKGHNVELFLQEKGNLPTRSIERGQW